MPLFLLPRPLLAQAERVWWGVSGSISLRTEGGRARREGGGREAIPTASPGSSCLYLYIYLFSDTVRKWSRDRGWGRQAGACAAGPGPQFAGLREPQRPPPLRAVDAPGYSWQRLPEQKLLGGVRGEGGRGRGERREGGRGRDSASDVIGSPSASLGGRLNQKNLSAAGRRGEGCAVRRRPGLAPLRAFGDGRSLRAPLAGSRARSPESRFQPAAKRHWGVWSSLRNSY